MIRCALGFVAVIDLGSGGFEFGGFGAHTGGEGLFLATLRGPGRVWLQTMPIMNVAKKIAEYLPRSGSGSSGSSGGIGLGDITNFFGGD